MHNILVTRKTRDVFLVNRAERRRQLAARYWFDCQCFPCSKNWPLLDSLSKNEQDEEILQNVDDLMKKGELQAAVDTLVNLIEEQTKTDQKLPSQLLIRLEDKLRSCINNCGNIVIPNEKL